MFLLLVFDFFTGTCLANSNYYVTGLLHVDLLMLLVLLWVGYW